MKNYDEVTNDLLERRDSYVTEQKNKRKRMISVVTPICCFCIITIMGFGIWRSGMLTTSPITLNNNSTISGNRDEEDNKMPSSQSGGQSNPHVNSQVDNPSNPENESSNSIPSVDNPRAELSHRTVSYQEAKELFGYPIIECLDENFTNYSIGVVSQNGNVCSYSEVIYSFTNDRITLFNQEKANLYSGFEDLGKKVEYNGYTFWIENGSPDEQQYYIRIGYFPNQENGICYIADVTDRTIEQTEIMDLILSLEIK